MIYEIFSPGGYNLSKYSPNHVIGRSASDEGTEGFLVPIEVQASHSAMFREHRGKIPDHSNNVCGKIRVYRVLLVFVVK